MPTVEIMVRLRADSVVSKPLGEIAAELGKTGFEMDVSFGVAVGRGYAPASAVTSGTIENTFIENLKAHPWVFGVYPNSKLELFSS